MYYYMSITTNVVSTNLDIYVFIIIIMYQVCITTCLSPLLLLCTRYVLLHVYHH